MSKGEVDRGKVGGGRCQWLEGLSFASLRNKRIDAFHFLISGTCSGAYFVIQKILTHYYYTLVFSHLGCKQFKFYEY